MPSFAENAKKIAEAYGPAMTTAGTGGDINPFKELFVSDEAVSVVIQNSEGEEMHFTVGDQEDATLSWADFQTTVCKDLGEQKYSKSVSECLGVLGDRFIMEVGRINEAGEVYMEGFSLVTINAAGKIIMIEGFSDVNAEGLVQAVE